jgi:hypothetical protein
MEGDRPIDGHERNKPRDLMSKASRRPESRSVTQAELRNLPLLAAVALAVRCVRRVQPLFRACRDDGDWERLHRTVESAIAAAAMVAAGANVPDMAASTKQLAELAREVSKSPLTPPADQVAVAAAHAAHAAAAALAGDAEETISQAGDAFWVTADLVAFHNVLAGDLDVATAELDKALCGQWDDSGADEMRDALATDYENLRTQDLGHFPNAGKPVDPSDQGPLGPLWPDGVPSWYARWCA